jgi:hypothetical protein
VHGSAEPELGGAAEGGRVGRKLESIGGRTAGQIDPDHARSRAGDLDQTIEHAGRLAVQAAQQESGPAGAALDRRVHDRLERGALLLVELRREADLEGGDPIAGGVPTDLVGDAADRGRLLQHREGHREARQRPGQAHAGVEEQVVRQRAARRGQELRQGRTPDRAVEVAVQVRQVDLRRSVGRPACAGDGSAAAREA